MVFIESQAFTRRLHRLAGASADQVLRQIQEDLLKNPEKQEDLTTEQRKNLRLLVAELKKL